MIPFIQALARYKQAYDKWVWYGRPGNMPDPGNYGVSQYEGNQLRSGMQPSDVYNAMLHSQRVSDARKRESRGLARDQRKKIKRTTKRQMFNVKYMLFI